MRPLFSFLRTEANLLSLIGSMPCVGCILADDTANDIQPSAGDRLRDIETEAAWNLSGECDESFRVRQNVMHGLQEPARDRDNRFVTEQTTAHELEKKIVEAKHQIDDTRNRLTQGLARFARLIFKSVIPLFLAAAL